MVVENLPTLEEVTKQLEEANAKKAGGGAPAAKAKSKGIPDDPDVDLPPEVEKPEVPVENQKPESLPGTEEAVTEEVPQEQKKEDSWSKKFAAMTRLDKKRREGERQLAEKMAAFEQKQRDFEAREASRLKISNPMEALKHHGFSYEDATYALLGSSTPQKEVDPVDQKVKSHLDPLGQKMSAIEEKLKELDEAKRSFEASQAAQAEREVKYAIQATARDGEYPYIQGVGDEAIQGVYDIMVAFYNKHKQYLTYKQACDRLEGYYKRIGSISSAKKDTVAATTVQKNAQITEPSQAKTLTQGHNTGTRTKPNVDGMSDREAKDFLAKTMLKYR